MAQTKARKKPAVKLVPKDEAAQANMVDLDQTFHDFNGLFFPDQTGKRPITLRDAIFLACSTPLRGDAEKGPLPKYEIGAAASAVAKGFTVHKDQWKMIQERTGEAIQSPVLAFLIRDALQPLADGTGTVKPREEPKEETPEDAPAL